MYLLELSSFAGFFFSWADDSIDIILKHTLLVFRAGVQSVLNVLKQIKPQEYICS